MNRLIITLLVMFFGVLGIFSPEYVSADSCVSGFMVFEQEIAPGQCSGNIIYSASWKASPWLNTQANNNEWIHDDHTVYHQGQPVRIYSETVVLVKLNFDQRLMVILQWIDGNILYERIIHYKMDQDWRVEFETVYAVASRYSIIQAQ